MGGKKKSIATKLAKMSDEERARYLQHRADMEEEAKKRKEHLINQFMKKKIKKEEDFARLNIAKINQHWHQLLRKAKCKEMKEHIEYLKLWIERVMNHKNRTIKRMLEALEETEEQYSNNFKTHSVHIDKMIEEQNQYMRNVEDHHNNELSDLLNQNDIELKQITSNAREELEYLQTIVFRQESVASKELRNQFENYMEVYYEMEYSFQSALKRLCSNLNSVNTSVWYKLASTIEEYVKQSNKKRSHLAELRVLDARSIEEIEENQHLIAQAEDDIQYFTEKYAELQTNSEMNISSLELEKEALNKKFLKLCKSLKLEQRNDEKKIELLSSTCYYTIQHLEKLNQKCEHIINITNICSKFKTDREKLAPYFLHPVDEFPTDDFSLEQNLEEQKLRDGPKDDAAVADGSPVSQFPEHSAEKTVCDTPETENLASIKNIILQEKPVNGESSPQVSPTTLQLQRPISILEKCFESLKILENFWHNYNKAKVDFMIIKMEKKVLEQHNKQLGSIIRSVLEALALSKSSNSSNISSRTPSRSRTSYSASFKAHASRC